MARVSSLQRLLGLRLKTVSEEDYAAFLGALEELRREEPPLPSPSSDWEQRSTAFVAWLAHHGSPLPVSLQLRHTPDRGTGLYAVQPLKANEPVITVPSHLWLSGNDAERAGLSALSTLYADPLIAASPAVRLALMLVAGGGAWASYVALLPAYLPSPALFSASAFHALRPSVSFAPALRVQITAARQYLHIASLLASPAVVPTPCAALLQPFTFARYAWALATVQSRLNPLPGGVHGLVPLWDLCNHSPSVPQSTHASPDQLTLRAPVPLDVGHELLMNYGPRTLQHLFLTYAFVPTPLPQPLTTCALSVPLAMRYVAKVAQARPTGSVEITGDGKVAADGKVQVRNLHGCTVHAWLTAIHATILSATATCQGSAADEHLVTAMLSAEASLLQCFLQHADPKR